MVILLGRHGEVEILANRLRLLLLDRRRLDDSWMDINLWLGSRVLLRLKLLSLEELI